MSKVLVIEDWGKFEKQLDIIDKTHEPVWLIQAIENKLLDHELKNVIEFEAIVFPHTEHGKSTTGQDVRFHGRCILLDDIFDVGEPVKVFIVRKESHEQDASHS